MSREARIIVWVAVLVATGWAIHALNDVLLPFVAGAAIAYMFDPVVDRLQKTGLSRTLSTTIVVLVVFLTIIGALALLLPLLQQQIIGFLRILPGIVEHARKGLAPLLKHLDANFNGDVLLQIKQAISAHAGTLASWLRGFVQQAWQSGIAIVNVLSLLVITPVVAFYLLRDWDDIVETIDSYLPREYAPTIREQIREIDRTVAGFLRGQASVCVSLAAYYSITLGAIGLNSGIVVGLVAGLISFIPFLGATTGFIVSMGIALVQYDGSIGHMAVVAGVFAVGQTLEGYVLTPKLVGDRVGLSPVWVIFALLAGGAVFGFTGVLLAVPVAASTGVLVRFALHRYRESSLYCEEPHETPQETPRPLPAKEGEGGPDRP